MMLSRKLRQLILLPSVLYILGGLCSYPLIAGWTYASAITEFCPVGIYAEIHSTRKAAGFALGWSVVASALWPVFLPGVYLITGFAEDGWGPYNLCSVRMVEEEARKGR